MSNNPAVAGGDGTNSRAHYEPIAVSAESTVVAEYVPDQKVAASYQSEADLEREFIRLLQGQAYEYLPVTSKVEASNPAHSH